MQTFNDGNAESGQQDAAAGTGRGKKMYYSISEACAMTGVEPHVLRYWEKEFSLLRPKKNSGGKRAYKEKDIEVIVKIKRMLEDKTYTLQGAKSKLADERRERRTGEGNATAIKHTKSGAEGGQGRPDSVESPTSESAMPSNAPLSMPVDAATKSARRESVPKGNNGRRGIKDDGGNSNDYSGGNGRGNDKALILSIRGELLEVLGLLEQ